MYDDLHDKEIRYRGQLCVAYKHVVGNVASSPPQQAAAGVSCSIRDRADWERISRTVVPMQ
jgi:hypothetical protein